VPVAQQSVSVQLHQPLAFLHVGLTARQVFGIPRVYQNYPYAMLRQYVMQPDPVHSGRLHRYRVDTAGREPPGHADQILRPAAEFLNRLSVTVRRDGGKMALVAHVYSSRIRIYDGQSRIAGGDLPAQFSALLSVETSFAQPFEGRLFLPRLI
jgi:hypothetical protein